jgi:hypothetical protein
MAVERGQKVIDQAAEERAKLLAWVRAVPDEAWSEMSPDGQWQARDYIAHLASIDPLLAGWFRIVQSGAALGGENTQGRRFDIDEWNEKRILERRTNAIDELLTEMAQQRVDLNAALAGFTDEQLDTVIHFGGDSKRSPRDLPLATFLTGWALHDRWHMEDARRAMHSEGEQAFGDAAFDKMMQRPAQA